MSPVPELSLPSLGSRMGARLLGSNPQLGDGIMRLRHAALIQVCGVLLIGLAHLAGLVSTGQVACMLAYFVVGWVAFYTLMRGGWSSRWGDPSLDTAVTVFGMGAIVLAYALMDAARGLALQLVCVVLVMHIDRLRLRRAILITGSSVAALTMTLATLYALSPERINLRIEIYNLALATLLLPIAVFLINETHRISIRAAQHSGALSATLAHLVDQLRRDEITGLPNQRHMSPLIQQEISRQARSGRPFCLAVFDVERAAPTSEAVEINQTLRQIARLADHTLAPTDTLAHWSPGRFVLLLPDTQLAEAQASIERLQRAIREHDWCATANGVRVTLSAGSTEHRIIDTLDDTLARATGALLRAQRGGPDHCATEPELTPHPLTCAAFDTAPRSTARQQAAEAPSAPPRQAPRPVMRLAPKRQTPPARSLDSTWPDWLTRGLRRLTDCALSADPAIRERLRLPLTGAGVYAAWLILMYAYARPNGLITPGFARWLTTYDLIGMLAFYAPIRSGWSARCSDPQLILPQMLYGCGACAASFAFAPDLRPEALQVMCFVQLFGMAALTPRSTRVIAVAAALMQLTALAWAYATRTDQHRFMLDALTVATSCFIVGGISLQSYRFSLYRQQVKEEQGALSDAVKQIQDQQIHDELTGLFNRPYLSEQLEREATRCRRAQRGFCVALISLDHLAHVRGRYTYAASDAMLSRLARTARAALRQTDLLGRWTQQEFLVLLPDTATSAAGAQALERLRQRVAAQPLGEQHFERMTTLSCGIAEYRDDASMASLLERAEQGLHAARASGGNRCVLAD